MNDKKLLWWGLGAGGIAILAALLGYLLFWSSNGYYGSSSYNMMGSGYGGMMGSGYGGMMGSGYGGMMGSGGMMGGPTDSSTAPLTIDQAADAARRYTDNYYGNSDLKVKEVIEFTNNFYARVDEQSTGAGAFELLVDRNSGIVTPEMGPNVMWNTKYGVWGSDDGLSGYGMMGSGGMMGGRGGRSQSGTSTTATTDMPIKPADARDRAQKFLDRQLPGTKAEEPDTFYGYYTIEIEKDGRLLGMLSVNGYQGQVWYHSWHGAWLSNKTY